MQRGMGEITGSNFPFPVFNEGLFSNANNLQLSHSAFFQGNGKPGSFSSMPGVGILLAGHMCQCWGPITVMWNYALNGHTSLSINASCMTFIEEIWTHTGILHSRFSSNAIK